MDPLRELTITPEILRLVAEVDEFKGRWQALGELPADRLTALCRSAAVDSVAASARLDGVRLTDREVEILLHRLPSLRAREEQVVVGYATVLEMVFDAWREITLSEDHVCQLHRDLLRFSSEDEHHRGRYKTRANPIEAFDAAGRNLGMVFETASPADTPRLMDALLRWTRATLEGGEHHPLLVVAVFVVRFLAIQPFEEGNGRLSRLLTLVLLLRAGYDYVPCCSLDRIVEDDRDGYRRSLLLAQTTLDRGEENLGGWIVFFLRTLARHKDALCRKVEEERRRGLLPPLEEEVLELARQYGRLTIRGVVEATGANRNTVKVHLRKLVDRGRLVQHGRGRATWYQLAG